MNKHIFPFLILFFVVKSTQAQEIVSVEKSIWQVQSLLVTKYLSNESRILDKIALRNEIGFDFSYRDGLFMENPLLVWNPFLRIEPRYYYNLQKRLIKGKKTAQNSGNFVALTTSYKPDWFVISNESGIGIIPNLSLIPTWGIRRSPTRHFNYEAGFGVGYGWEFYKVMPRTVSMGEVFVNLHLRIGLQL
ncbi:hypothetical protein A33Q_0042 [Indibacter alkaliphilus LW1]|uniref:DUF3575 domain-containing protein n=1 Tax=Indibacter alkaliphilus (strain CCUG 57479 / KCTC 22604 / LW1) TaxID=1189612 RepID=S2EE02_INDAL|nr:hypothetical protein [Indibacter alkaliphilus]EPA00569.1 hypothetical protein A33Q_0042 [Indibacter alkaliphilus LW1]